MKHITIGLIGNPNCGKSTLFNGLTGAKQSTGNWPGVTVERKVGYFNEQNYAVSVVDLPGIYSLTSVTEQSAIDEKITCDFILTKQADLIVNIIDATNLERNLYITTQLLEMRVPMIVAINMMDLATRRNLTFNFELLAKELGCPVVPIEANKAKGLEQLKAQIVKTSEKALPIKPPSIYYGAVKNACEYLTKEITAQSKEHALHADWIALRLLEEDVYAQSITNHRFKDSVDMLKNNVKEAMDEEVDVIIADARYGFANHVASSVMMRGESKKAQLSLLIDQVVLNRFWGIPIFLTIMYLMFVVAINLGGIFQDFFDIGSETIFVNGVAHYLQQMQFPNWLVALLASGVGKGINTTLTFIPVIGAMYLCLSLLEDSGYMARAAFIMDRLMRTLGLPGKAFVPLIIGFGCNVPSVMATRSLDQQRDRILTALLSPFMSCSARLAIFAVFTAAFFPHAAQNIVFALYIIGVTFAMLTGLFLRRTLLSGESSHFIMELPPYHAPTFRTVIWHTWRRLRGFVFRAGKFIIPICMIIGTLNALYLKHSDYSILATFGKYLTPVFAPMGLHEDNWPATVGLLTGILAKEIVIGTLNTLYTQVGHLVTHIPSQFSLWDGLHQALLTIPHNFLRLKEALINPVLASMSDHAVAHGVFGEMSRRFDGAVGAFAYLLFILLYIPCVSTIAAISKEIGRQWALFAVFWNTSLAYGLAVLFYQTATLNQHPLQSLLWIVGILCFYLLLFSLLRYKHRSNLVYA
ncbi:MAG: Fe(2+) transporter permease subunit FeoB [Gammaproteobacteria bacterium]